MSKNIAVFLKVLVGSGLALILLYFVFRNVEWEEFWKRAKEADYTWVIISILLSLVAYLSRAYRWNILLEPLGYKLKTSRTVLAVMIGYLANMALPRLGEITRCGVLNRNEKVSVPEAIGSVVTERIFDVLTLLILILISLIMESDRLFTFLSSAYQDFGLPIYLIPILIGFAVIIFIGAIVLIKRQKKSRGKLANIVRGFVSGVLSLKDIKKPVGFVVSTVILWMTYYLMSYLIVFSIPETSHLGLGAGFMLLITGGIALSIPVQNGFGTYHGMIAGMLLLYSIDETTGIFLATLLHTSQIVAIAVFGSVAILISSLLRKENRKKETI